MNGPMNSAQRALVRSILETGPMTIDRAVELSELRGIALLREILAMVDDMRVDRNMLRLLLRAEIERLTKSKLFDAKIDKINRHGASMLEVSLFMTMADGMQFYVTEIGHEHNFADYKEFMYRSLMSKLFGHIHERTSEAMRRRLADAEKDAGL